MRCRLHHSSSLARLALVALVIGACTPDESTAPGASTEPPAAGGPIAGRQRVEGFRSRGEIRSGWVLGRAGRPMRIAFEVHNDRAIWQGDIDLGPANEVSTTAEGARPLLRMDDTY